MQAKQNLQNYLVTSLIVVSLLIRILTAYFIKDTHNENEWNIILNKYRNQMIEDKKITLSRAYRPTIVLVSDGNPTDNWEDPLDDFINACRSQ